jgi:uncharacterized metal-binding protein YceD (DUF177 family)
MMKDEQDIAEKIVVDVARLPERGETLEGEADIVDLDEEFVKPFGGVRYSLSARLYGKELLVKGRLEQDFDLVCSRCGRDFDTTIKVEDFVFSAETDEKTEFVDLTNDARECIILALPTYPVCDEECPGIEQKSAEAPDERWSALDGLKVEEKKRNK